MSRIDTIHQFVPTLGSGDAVGQHTLQVQALLRDLGFKSEIYAERSTLSSGRPYSEHSATPGSAVIYQFAIGSVLSDFLRERGVPLALDYHNITPPKFFEPWEPALAHGLAWGVHQVHQLQPHTTLGIADSTFNQTDLVECGYRRTVVAPILLDPGSFDGGVDEGVLGRLGAVSAGGGASWLFVGRMAPNKAQHDVVKAFALYRRVFDSRARLWLVGGSSSDAYVHACRELADRLGVGSAVEFAGSVSQEALTAYYRSADVFVCLSDHEGFCVPLLEAMWHGVPVVAFGSSAVPETLGLGGVCLPEKSAGVVASAVWRVVSDRLVREGLVAAGRRRLADFELSKTRAIFTTAIEQFVEAA